MIYLAYSITFAKIALVVLLLALFIHKGLEWMLRALASGIWATADAYGAWRNALLASAREVASRRTWVRSFRTNFSRSEGVN